jgi:hypothetical protein
MSRCNTPGPLEILILGIIVVLLFSGTSAASKVMYSVRHWAAAVQTRLDALRPRKVAIICSCLLLGTLVLVLLLRG